MKNDEFIMTAENRIENAITDATIAEKILQFGYTPERMAVGKGLLDSAKTLQLTCANDHTEVDVAYKSRDAEKEIAQDTLHTLRNIGKVAFKNNVAAKTTLKINVAVPKVISAWKNYTETFYTNLLANEEWLTDMAEYGITKEKIELGLAQYNAVGDISKIILRDKGEAQNATQERNQAFDLLREWLSDFTVIAKEALADSPQLLEKLGIIVKS